MEAAEETLVAKPRPAPEGGGGETVRRAQGGDADAFEELAVAYAPRLYRMLVLRLGDERDARDALQETLLAAWQGLPRLREPEHFWSWLAGIAAHKAADAGRRRLPVAQAAEEAVGDSSVSLELREAIRALPPHLRDVVLLRYVAQLSEEETARALRIRVGTVKSRAARARQALAEVIG